MIYKSASEHAQSILNREYKITDLVDAYYAQIDKHNAKINAIVINNKKAAHSRAEQLEKILDQEKKPGPLHGVPVTVKEAFNMKGLRTTVNYPKLKDYVPDTDSIFVERLYEAGAIILGKTNVPLLLSDSQTFGPLYPTCNNPYDVIRTPGGSTGGGAAAVAAGMATFELGSDIGGSIRNPSHYCGLFGLKPTQNAHHQDGHVPPLPGSVSGVRAMESTGPLARSMSDIELAYDVLYRPRWDYMKFLPVEHRLKKHDHIGHYKLGYFTHMGPYGCSSDTVRIMDQCIARLRKEGVSMEKVELDSKWVKEVMEIWAFMFGVIMGQDVNWFVRQLLKLKFRKDTGGRLNLMPSLARGLGLVFKDYSRMLRRQQECKMELNKLFDQYDFILSPTSAGSAFHHNPKHKPIMMDGEKIHYFDYCFPYVMLYNAMENPVLDFPAGQDSQGLPIGLQIAAPQHAERPLIHFGKLIEALGFTFSPPDLDRGNNKIRS